ncbi:MAG: glycosyltransferase family 39 protein [bacterium]|nr:MAG: glycosyltransferase family 39 protein [bacterium]
MSSRDLFTVLACTALFALLLYPLAGSLVDDTYIHLQYARNLAEDGDLSFNRGHPTYGATSPLWVALLSIIYRMGGEIFLWCQILSWLFGILAVRLAYRMALELSGTRLVAAAAGLMLASEAWFVRWSAVGMETSFAVFMILATIYVALSAHRSAIRSLLFGAMLFLAILSRPEALLLVPLAVFVSIRFGPPTPGRRMEWLMIVLPLFAVWLLVIKSHTGAFMPLTAGAKQGRLVFTAAVVRRALVPIKIMGITDVLPWCALLVGACAGLIKHRSIFYFFESGHETNGARRAGILLAILWVIALPVVYVLFDFQVLSRYLLPVIPPVIVLGTTALWGLVRHTGKPVRRAVIVAFLVVAVAQNVIVYTGIVVPSTRAFSRGMKEVLVGMGEWLFENADDTAVVATPDIGAIGYVSQREILDLGGLVTPEINRMRQDTPVETIIVEGLYLRFQPDYLVDRHETAARFGGMIIRGVRFEPVMQGTVPNLGIRKPYPVVYTLYRLIPGAEGAEGSR